MGSMLLLWVVGLILLVGNIGGIAAACDILNTVPNPSPKPDAQSPDAFVITIETSAVSHPEPIVIFVNRSWAPLGADRLYSLVQDGFYNQAGFFRVVPDFVVQFGISADPSETAKWNTNIPDDPVLASNVAWTVTYATAGPDTRTTQLFINYIDNSRLDEMGFSPFGVVISGFDTALAIYNPTPDSSDGVDQDAYTNKGNDWLLANYPEVSLITCATISSATNVTFDLPVKVTNGWIYVVSIILISVFVLVVCLLFLLFGRKWCFKLDDTKSCRDYIYSELRHRSDEEEDEIEEEDNDGTNAGSLGGSSSSSSNSRRNCDSSRSGRSEIELSAVK
jgi:cyclophilin family peptidyl-prolyl cis-trans isomerase